MGAITNITKTLVPASYRAMIGASNSYYKQSDLQTLNEYVQSRVFSTVAIEASEAFVYSIKERQLLGILTTLQFIPAALDFWGDAYSSESANSASSTKSVGYFDHRADLWKIFDRLTQEAQQLSVDLGVNINAARAFIPKVSYGDNGREILITSDPQDFERAYDLKTTDSSILWGEVIGPGE